MYRKSSKGNPYHDARGRFARKDSMGVDDQTAENSGLIKVIKGDDSADGTSDGGKKPQIVDDRRAVMWSSFGEQVDIKKKTVKQAEKIDRVKTNDHMTDGKRFYHNQSIKRENVARGIADFKIKKGTPRKDRSKVCHQSREDFVRENHVAIKRGGKVVALVKGQQISYQVIESGRMANETSKKKSIVTRDTSTSMKLFHGYTVAFGDDKEIRSCKKNTTLSEAKEHLSKYCAKHKSTMAQKNVCIQIWRDEKTDRVFYQPVYHFNTKEEADAFAKANGSKKAVITNHDDGSMA